MKILKAIDESKDEVDAITLLESINTETATEAELKALVNHLRYQFKNRYRYIIGEWRSAHRAKSTVDGKFVTADEIIKYMEKTEA